MTSEEVEAFRSEICATAQRLFIEEGYAKVGLRAIGAEIGITATALYRYFPGGKEEILATVRSSVFTRFAQLLEEASATGPDTGQRLRQQGHTYIQFAIEHPDEYRLMFDQVQQGDWPYLQAASNRARDALYSLFDELLAEGYIDGDACAATHAYWAALHGAVLLHTSQQLNLGIDIDDLLETILNFTLKNK
ncbi:MAG: TetR/AcrR family transcriptional regulator [Gammaproteobacteria bacterium]|nr:TetR/AcrR family transcriptional regulator [Gammaproteobacteria bacterium]